MVIACAAWPVVTRLSSAPRWLFFRLAVLVTLVLWAPDLYILDLGQPARAVAVLIVMHLAIALVTQVHIPYRIAYAFFIALRIIPTIEEEIKIIRSAQAVRSSATTCQILPDSLWVRRNPCRSAVARIDAGE